MEGILRKYVEILWKYGRNSREIWKGFQGNMVGTLGKYGKNSMEIWKEFINELFQDQ